MFASSNTVERVNHDQRIFFLGIFEKFCSKRHNRRYIFSSPWDRYVRRVNFGVIMESDSSCCRISPEIQYGEWGRGFLTVDITTAEISSHKTGKPVQSPGHRDRTRRGQRLSDGTNANVEPRSGLCGNTVKYVDGVSSCCCGSLFVVTGVMSEKG